MSHAMTVLPFVCHHQKHGREDRLQLGGRDLSRGHQGLAEFLDGQPVVIATVILRRGPAGRSHYKTVAVHITRG